MAVVRIEKTKDYTVMSNKHLKEKDMSLKAKGLLSVMLSLPDNWDYSIEGLVSICCENETAIKSTLKELKYFGYLQVIKERTTQGTFTYNYIVYETPRLDEPALEEPQVENPPMDNPPMDEPAVENQGQLNTKESNTKELNKKESNTKKFNTKGAVYYPDNEQLNDLFIEYIKMRKTIKKPLTENGIKRKMIKLDKLAGLDNDIACKIIEQAIDHCWQDFYPLKDNKLKQQTSQLDAIMNA